MEQSEEQYTYRCGNGPSAVHEGSTSWAARSSRAEAGTVVHSPFKNQFLFQIPLYKGKHKVE